MRPSWFASRLERRNFAMLTFDGVLYFAAATLLDATILIPLFLEHVSGSPLLIGLAAAVRHLGFVLPQLWIAKYMHRIHRLDRFVFWSYLVCRFALLFVLGAFVYDPSSTLVLIAFFLGYTMFAVGEGVTQVPWMDVFGRTISPRNHGKLFGLTQTFGALGSFGSGIAIQHVLSHPEQYPYPSNFMALFGLASVLLLFSTLSFLYVREGPRRSDLVKNQRDSWRLLFQGLRRAWQMHRAFRTLVIVQVLVGVHQLAMPFYILYVESLSGNGMEWIGWLVMAQIIGSVAGGVLFGALSTKRSNRATIRVTALLNVAVPLLILLAGVTTRAVDVQWIVWIAFFAMGVISGGWIGFTNYLMEISNDETRGRYVAYLNLCTAPLALLPVFSGSILNLLPYDRLFVIVLILLLVALYESWRLPTTIPRRQGGRAVRTDRQTNAAPQ